VTTKPTKRTYHSPLREEQAKRTRALIVEAAIEELQHVRPENLTFRTLAKRAGVAVRTVYRHFPEIEGLLGVIARQTMTRWLGPELRISDDLGEALQQHARFLETVEADPSVYRLLFAAPVRSGSQHNERIRSTWGPLVGELPDHGRDSALGLMDLMVSPYAWDVLHSHWGHDAKRTRRAVTFAMQAIVDAFQRDPDALDPERSIQTPTLRPAADMVPRTKS
jgi:AcrR family transcriptional regulator